LPSFVVGLPDIAGQVTFQGFMIYVQIVIRGMIHQRRLRILAKTGFGRSTAIRNTRDSDHELECEDIDYLCFCINAAKVGILPDPFLIYNDVPENPENLVRSGIQWKNDNWDYGGK
jgi:hypothetical protein